ncbi:MAG: hypothetical protein HYY16_01245 [Planctomycetes bacterium]|nr:hypothetical protein [Planctomycetota bacterium]
MKPRRFLPAATILGITGCAILLGFAFKDPAVKTPVKKVTVMVRHLEYQNFSATYDLELRKKVYIHDTHYWLILKDFTGDFFMDPKTREITSRSSSLRNPGAKITLGHMDKPVYTQWFFKEEESRHEIKAPGFIITVVRVEQP